MRCANCGAENPEGVAFCASCGTPLTGGYNQQGYDTNYGNQQVSYGQNYVNHGSYAQGYGNSQVSYNQNYVNQTAYQQQNAYPQGYGNPQGGYGQNYANGQPAGDPNYANQNGYPGYPGQDTSGMPTGAFLAIVLILIALIAAEVVLFIAPGILTERHYDEVTASSRARSGKDEEDEDNKDKDDEDKDDKDKDDEDRDGKETDNDTDSEESDEEE